MELVSRQLASAQQELASAQQELANAQKELTSTQQELFSTKLDLEGTSAGLSDTRKLLNHEQREKGQLKVTLEKFKDLSDKRQAAAKCYRESYAALDRKARDTAKGVTADSVLLYDDPINVLDAIRTAATEATSKLKTAEETFRGAERSLWDLKEELFTVLSSQDTDKTKVGQCRDVGIRMSLVLTGLNNQ